MAQGSAAARRRRGTARGDHRAGRDRDLQQRDPRAARPARRRAGRAAARRDPRRPRRAARRGLRRGRGGAGAAPRRRLLGLVRFEDEETATVIAGWGRARRGVPGRRPAADRRGERHLADRADRPAGSHRRLRARRGERRDRGARAPPEDPHRGRRPDRGRRTALGRDDRRGRCEGAAMPPDAEPPARAVHRAGRHRDLQHRGARRARAARGRAGGAAARGDAGRGGGARPRSCSPRSPRRSAGVLGQRIDSAILRLRARRHGDRGRGVGGAAARAASAWARDCRSTAAASPRRCSASGARSAWTTTPPRTARSPTTRGCTGSAPRSAARSWCTGRLWGAMVVAHYEAEPFAADTERRVSQFTELVATAIANAEARAELQRLADEQAALRRVATLVAEAAAPTEVFDAVIVEVAQLLGAAQVGMMRVESPNECTIVAQRGQDPDARPTPGCGCRSTATASPHASCGPDARRGSTSSRRGSGAIAELARRSNVNADGRRADHGRGRGLGRDHRELEAGRPPARRRGGAPGRVRGAARHGDRERRQPRSAHRIPRPRAHRRRRGAPTGRPRPPRRCPAAPRPHDRHAEARAAGAPRGRRSARSRSSPRRSITPSRATPSCASWPTGSSRRS